MKVKIKKIRQEAVLPRKAFSEDAGFDIFSAEERVLRPGERKSIATGIASKIQAGYVGLVWDKSGMAHKKGIKVLGGVIDAGYTGEWFIGLVNLSQEDYKINKGDKIAQVLFQRVENPQMEIVKELEETERGKKGFGSTGKR